MYLDDRRDRHRRNSNTGTFSGVFLVLILSTLLGVGLAACGGRSATSASLGAHGVRNKAPSPAASPHKSAQPEHSILAARWSAIVGPAATAVACPTYQFCMAVLGATSSTAGTGTWSTWNGRSWSPLQPIATGGGELVSLSCANHDFCVAADVSGNVLEWDGSAWSSPVSLGARAALSSVSCPTVGFCLAVGVLGQVYEYSRNSWVPTAAITATSNPANGYVTMACASAQFCFSGNGMSQVAEFNGSTWSNPTFMAPYGLGITSISCPNTTFCMAVTNSGDAVEWKGGTWEEPVSVINHKLVAVSCPNDHFCVAVGNGTKIATYSGRWVTEPIPGQTPYGGLVSVSCASQLFCMAVSGGTQTFTYTALTH